jgi:hypothetical protein
MKDATRKTLKHTIIAAALVVAFAPFVPATAAGVQPVFDPVKTAPAPAIQSDANISAAVVYVTAVYPEPAAPAGFIGKIKARFEKKDTHMDYHAVGVYVGNNLVLTTNASFQEGAKYRVTLAYGNGFDATPYRQQDGLMLLRLTSPGVLPVPVKIASKRSTIGDDVVVFAQTSDTLIDKRYTVMSRAYVNSSQPIRFFLDPKAAPLMSIKTDRTVANTEFDGAPVFSRSSTGGLGELVGMAIMSSDDKGGVYIVPADEFVAGVSKHLAKN